MEEQLAVEAKKRQQEAARRTNAALGRKVETQVEKIPQASQGKTRDHVATTVGVNPHYISDAKAIKEKAPEVLAEVRLGTLNMGQAKQVAELPPEARPAAIRQLTPFQHGQQA